MRFTKNWIWLVALGGLAMAGMLTYGCAGEEAVDPCRGVTCSGHGTCLKVAGKAQCDCETDYQVSADGKACWIGDCVGKDCSGLGECWINASSQPECKCNEGYMQDPQDPLKCVPERCLEVGEWCSTNSDCCGNECMLSAYEGDKGYCTTRECTTDSQCSNHSTDSRNMCCLGFGGGNFICLKIGAGYSCGDRSGGCGVSCTGQIDTACDESSVCLSRGLLDPGARCGIKCITDNDCSGCQDPVDPSIEFSCQLISGGDTYCLAAETGNGQQGDPCPFGEINATADVCQADLVCLGVPASPDTPACTVAEDCSNDSNFPPEQNPDCAGGHCGLSFCSGKCDANGDCDSGFVAIIVSGTCYCMPVPIGTSGAGDPCPFDTINATANYCQAGLACLGVPASVNTPACTVASDCQNDPNFPPEQNPDCADGHCGLSFCSPRCDANGECIPDFIAIIVSGTCYCMPVPIGSSAAGAACPFDTVNATADYCQSGLTCLGIPASVQTPACTVASDCQNDPNFPPEQNPDCADGHCGLSFCSPRCNAVGDCDPGFGAIDVGGTCYCMPVPVGNSAAGDPCPFDTVNATADYCQAGLSCLGVLNSDTTPACTTGTDCTSDPNFPAVQNPDCVNGHCGQSFCSPRCDANGDCNPGFAPIDVSGKCYCVPIPVGNSAAGAACPFDTVNATADFCQAGLSCLGVLNSDTTPACTTGTDCTSDPNFPAVQNPDCVNGHCGQSFCSPRCDANGDCNPGFAPIDVSGKCYCMPIPVGNSAAGAACPFDTVNAAADFCQAGLSCLGLPAETTNPTCTISSDCLANADFPQSKNPDCVTGYCGLSFCAARCDVAGNCVSGFVPTDVGGKCYCEPQ